MPAEDLAIALTLVDSALLPCSSRVIQRELARLRAVTVSRDAGEDLKLVFAAYLEELADYPEDIVIAACRAGWKFWPALAELIEQAKTLVSDRKWLAAEIKRRQAIPEMPIAALSKPEPRQPGEPSDEDRDYVSAVCSRIRAGLKAATEAPARFEPCYVANTVDVVALARKLGVPLEEP